MARPIRFVHCSGFYFDCQHWEGPPSWVKTRSQDSLLALERLLDLCRCENIDVLLIAGNLFEQQSVTKKTVERVARSMQKLSGTRVFIAPGGSDPLITSSAYRLVNWPENVHVFSGETSRIDIPDLGVTVWGLARTTYQLGDDPPLEFFADDFDRENEINLLVFHGPLREEQIAASNLTYVALGSGERWSGLRQAGNSYWADCGPVMAINSLAGWPHGVVLGEIDGSGVSAEFRELDPRPCKEKGTFPDLNKEEELGPEEEAKRNQPPYLAFVISQEINKRLCGSEDADKEKHWQLVERILMSALKKGRESKHSEQEHELYRLILNLQQTGEETLSVSKIRGCLARAEQRLRAQAPAIEETRARYEELRKIWEQENHCLEEERLLHIEMKQLQAALDDLKERINEICRMKERLAVYRENPDYPELRRFPVELHRLDEILHQTEEEMAVYINDPEIGWETIESIRRDFLEWESFQPEKYALFESLTEETISRIARLHKRLTAWQKRRAFAPADQLLKRMFHYSIEDKLAAELQAYFDQYDSASYEEFQQNYAAYLSLKKLVQQLDASLSVRDANQILEIINKTAVLLRTKQEAEKERFELDQEFHALLGDRNMEELVRQLEPLRDLEREACISDEQREEELKHKRQELSEKNSQLKQALERLQQLKRTRPDPHLETEMEKARTAWINYEALKLALKDCTPLLETSLQTWQKQYGRLLEQKTAEVFYQTYGKEPSFQKIAILGAVGKYYHAYRTAATALAKEFKAQNVQNNF